MKTMLSALAVFACASASFGAGEMFPFVPSYDAPDKDSERVFLVFGKPLEERR